MAYALVKSTSTDNLEPPLLLPTYGSVHIWVDTVPSTPTNLWVMLGDFALTDDPRLIDVRKSDLNTVETKMQVILQRAQVILGDYGMAKRHGFHMDIQVPQSLVDRYI